MQKKLMLKILNEFGNPFAIDADDIRIIFPYDGTRTLEKTLKNGVKIIDKVAGELQVEFDDFEIQGLNAGDRQSFVGVIKAGLKTFDISFPGALSVGSVDGRKSLL